MPSLLPRVANALHWRASKAWSGARRSRPQRALAARSRWARRQLVPRSTPLTLRFANVYGQPLPELRSFADEVASLSGGDVRVRFDDHWVGTGNRHEETACLAGAVRNHVDLCWAGTRAFGCLGVGSLDPLQAPLLLDSYAAVEAVCRDDVIDEMLEPLRRVGLVGLVVLPGALRKPFAFGRPLAGPEDYAGMRLRIHESVVAERTCRALGAEPVLLSADQMGDDPRTRVDGMDLQAAAIASWGFTGWVTFNVDLWPRTIAIVASRRTYEWLGRDERTLLGEAGQRALDRAVGDLAGQAERDREVIPADVNVVTATAEQLAALRDRLEPVYAYLRAQPDTRDGLSRLEALVSRASTAS